MKYHQAHPLTLMRTALKKGACHQTSRMLQELQRGPTWPQADILAWHCFALTRKDPCL